MIQGVYDNLVRTGIDNFQRLQSLTSDGSYTLSDGERMRAIEKIAAAVKAQAKGVSEYIRTTDLLIAWRQQEYQQMNELVKWRGNL